MNSIQKGDYAQEIYRTEGSVRIEQEVILPDYCPDITRLVRVEMTPVFEKSRAYLQDNILTVEVSGRAEFNALYTDGGMGCEAYEFSENFNCSFKKDIGRTSLVIPESAAVCVLPVSTSVSPRVMSPRKLLARGEIKLSAEVFANLEYNAYEPSDDVASHRVDVESCNALVSRVVSSKNEMFTLSQEIKLPASLPCCGKVLSCTANISVDSVHPSCDSVAVFLGVNFNVLYLSEETGEREAELVSFYQPVEVRESFDCDDCAEDSICRVRAVPGKASCTMLVDSYGENRAFSLELPYTLNCITFENIEASLVEDVYGVGALAECERGREDFMHYVGSLSEACPFREKFLLKTDASILRGAVASAVLKSVSVTDEGAFADVVLEVGAVTVGDEGVNGSFSESLDMRFPINVPESILSDTSPDKLICDATVLPVYVDMQANSGSVELSGELAVGVRLWERSAKEFVKNVSFTEREKKSNVTVFYYPSASDTLWDVGRRYGVERQKIREVNGIENDELPSVVRIP